jgi:energy-coupling factor transporter transmembrane protein EcfT
MAELSVFAYRQGDSVAHRLDPRIKLISISLLSAAILAAQAAGLFVATGLIIGATIYCRVSLRQIGHELRWLLFMLVAVWGIRALVTPGETLFSWSVFSVSRTGVLTGAIICWRWVIIVFLGLTVSVTTRTEDIRAAVEWFLRPFPWLSPHRIGTMIGLLIRFIPVILTHAREMGAAQRARCVENRKNPLYRLRVLALPLLRRTFVTADYLTMAMEARCYGRRRTAHAWHFGREDGIVLVGMVLISSAISFC